MAKLKKELLKYNKENGTTAKKKWNRGNGIEDVINAEMIVNSADKEWTDENENLKKQQTIVNHMHKSQVKDEVIEVRRSLPVPNAATIIEEINSSINKRFAEIKDVIGSLIDEKLDRKLETVKQVSYSG